LKSHRNQRGRPADSLEQFLLIGSAVTTFPVEGQSDPRGSLVVALKLGSVNWLECMSDGTPRS